MPFQDVVKGIAEKIADDLFTNSNGNTAARLVLEGPNREQFGGWARGPLVDVIVNRITRELAVGGPR